MLNKYSKKRRLYTIIKTLNKGIEIGDYNLYKYDNDTIWIEHKSGEGGQFSKKLFSPILDKFYKKYF